MHHMHHITSMVAGTATLLFIFIFKDLFLLSYPSYLSSLSSYHLHLQ